MLDPIPNVPNVIKLFSTHFWKSGASLSGHQIDFSQVPNFRAQSTAHQPKQFSPKTNNREICSAIILPSPLGDTTFSHPINYLRLAAFSTYRKKFMFTFSCPKITTLKLLRISTKRIMLGPFCPPGIWWWKNLPGPVSKNGLKDNLLPFSTLRAVFGE